MGVSVGAGEASGAVSQTFALRPAEVFVRNGCRPRQVPDRGDQLNRTLRNFDAGVMVGGPAARPRRGAGGGRSPPDRVFL